MKIEQENIGYFGLDALELRIKKNNLKISLPEINHTNTPEAYTKIGEYTLRIRLGHTPSSYTRNYVFEIQYQMFDEDTFILTNDYLHAFSYLVGGYRGSVAIGDKLVIHSTFFAYMIKSGCNHEAMYHFLNHIVHDLTKTPIRRADIALDVVNITRPVIISHFEDKYFSSKIGKRRSDPVHQTHYIGQYQATSNRNYLVRIYDKIEDTSKKQKSFLFGHYSQFQCVTRIEIELRELFFVHVGKGEQDSDFQKFDAFSVKDLLTKPDIINSIFKKKINIYSDFDLGDLKFQPYSRYIFPLKHEYLKAQHIPKTYMSRFLGYSKKILEQTGPHGYAQAFFGIMPDKRKSRQNTQYKIDEMKLFEVFVRYFFRSFPQHKQKIISIIASI